MFERNPIDTGRMMAVGVALSLKDGSFVTGRAGLANGKSIARLLDGPDEFLFVETFSGEGFFVPKGEIGGVKVIDTGRLQPLTTTANDGAAFDPWRTLGLETGASLDQIKAAYLKLTRAYHPDGFASVTLPREVAAYLDGRCKQFNAAFEILRRTRQAEPIWTSPR